MEHLDSILSVDDCKIVNNRIREAKEMLEQEHGRVFTWEEATNAYRSIENLALVAMSYANEEFRRRAILKENPKGYHFDRKGYCCAICQRPSSGVDSWCDKNGLKCIRCQAMIDQKIIPSIVATNRKSWYSESELHSYFNIDGKMLKKYTQQSKIIVRQLVKSKDQEQMKICLLRDNKYILPPKKILEGRLVRVIKNGEEWYAEQHWYEFMSLKSFETLHKKYRVFDYLFETFKKPLNKGRLFAPAINPIFLPKNIPLAEFVAEGQ